MQISPVATPPEIEEALSSGSPSARTLRVEVIMPFPRISPTKRPRISATDLARTNRLKRARCTVGSPTLRIISQIQLSTPTTRRSPRSPTTQNSSGKTRISKGTSRQLRSIYWKEFDPITQNGQIVYAKCMHCHEYLSGKQNIGTSHLKKHLERCKSRSRVTEFVDNLRAGATPSDIECLEN